MPVALIEAQLAGIPVVAVDVGSVAEVVADGQSGYVFDRFGAAYIQRVRELTLENLELKALGQRAKMRAKAEFSLEKLINSHLSLFDEILSR
jgi:glycosyltransferase involved in cell wall biosynthesis